MVSHRIARRSAVLDGLPCPSMTPGFDQKHILFLAPCFLSRRLHKSIRGVEVFDLHFLRDLAALGIRLTIPADISWKHRFEEHLAGVPFTPVYTPSFRKPLPNGTIAALRIGKTRFDALLLGNPSRGLTPALKLLHRRRCFERGTLIAHRTLRDEFAASIRGMNLRTIAVNGQIAAQASALTGQPVDTYYGLPNASEFTPADSPGLGDGIVRMCIIGNLADACKGTDVAIEAFLALPEAVRERAELHLASFKNPPEMPDPRIIAHPWKHSSKMPAFLREMDIMLVPSTMETFSQAIVQGMLTALPIVSSEVPALVEKLDTGGGFVCASHDDYVRAMATLIEGDDTRRKMGQIARTTATERYVWNTEHFVRTYLFDSPESVTA